MISLVTGGAGFIGAHVTNELIGMGHKVIVLDDLSGGFEDHINNSAIFIKHSSCFAIKPKNLGTTIVLSSFIN